MNERTYEVLVMERPGLKEMRMKIIAPEFPTHVDAAIGLLNAGRQVLCDEQGVCSIGTPRKEEVLSVMNAVDDLVKRLQRLVVYPFEKSRPSALFDTVKAVFFQVANKAFSLR